jgi:hypothetical protein
MKERISRSVLVIVITGILLASLIIWKGLSRPGKTAQPENSRAAVEAGTTTPNDASARAPVAPTKNKTVLRDLVPLPFDTILTEAENGMWTSDKGFSAMPRGTQSFGGIEFHIDGLLQMKGNVSESRRQKYRDHIALPLAEAGVTNAEIGSIHFLGGTEFRPEPGAEVAEVVWHYLDGGTRRSRLNYDEHIRDWYRIPYEEPARLPYEYAKVVWRANEPTATGYWLRLYKVTLGNPEPQKAVRQIELASGRSAATLFIIAATLDPLGPGIRPDDSPDLEPTDAIPPRYLDVWVQTSEGQPLGKADVKTSYRLNADKGAGATKQLRTDESGVVRVAYPPNNLGTLTITASHDDYAARKMSWDVTAGDTIPASYQLKLTAGVNIGGSIVDESNYPIADAKLSFYRFWSGGENMNRKGEQPDFTTRNATSDSQGAWQMKNLPRDLLANIGFNVEHPDFLSTNLTVGNNDATEKQLRAGTMKIVMYRGLEVRGLVTDENGSPLSDATVSAGNRYSRERHQTNSDSAGRFVFPNIAQGDMPFSAMAKGRAPVSKTFRVHAGMPDVLLKLGPGAVIKGIVQNQTGEPISDVQVSLENNGPNEPAYEFSTKTGTDGRFLWDGAPDEEMQFYFGKSGYAQKRRVTLKLNEENIITLGKPREVNGQVVDAESGQPVTNFNAAPGHSYGLDPDQFNSNYAGTRDFSDANGQFTLSLDEEEQNAIRVGAADYANQTQSIPTDQQDVIKMEFRLKPSPAIHGTAVGTDGAPLPGVQVTLTKEGFGGPSISWRGGKLVRNGGGPAVVTTDSDGKFTVGPPPESGGIVVALGESGFASASAEEVRSSGILMLQAFGQVEGTFAIGGQPVSGRELMFTLQNVGIMTDFDKFKVTTDDDGKFKFEKVPAGEGQLVRLIKTTPNSWMHSHTTTVNVQPGQTTYVNLGDAGAVIRGRVRLETPPTGDDEPLTITGNLHTVMDTPPSFSSPEQANAFYKSPEWMARMKQQKYFAVLVNADGSFVLDSIPPGSYALNMNAAPAGDPFGQRPGMHSTSRAVNLTVPDSPDPMAPIDVGEIVLSKPVKKPAQP